MKHLLILFCISLASPLFGRSAADRQKLLEEIKKLEQEYGGHLGYMAKNLNGGETVGYNASERFPTASVIKLPVMAAFFHLVDQKQLDPHARVIMTKEDKKPGSGILQYLSDGASISLLDAVRLMITMSDNTATNLVLDRLAATHPERMGVVNDFMLSKGLKNTKILNRLYSITTKLQTPEAIRYGIGVSTPEDMVHLLDTLYSGALVKTESTAAIIEILKHQMYRDMIPRFLPQEDCKYLEVANKTGSINETKVDVGLILSDKVNIALAIFVDKHPDHRDTLNNRAVLLAAHVARAIWNYFTGGSGYDDRRVPSRHVDWNSFPGGRWAIYRSPAAPFPHEDRIEGFKSPDGTYYPYFPHYADDSVTVVVPDGFRETPDGANVIVHFHGHVNDNMGALEQYGMPQALIARKINALLVLPQGPYRAKDSFGGKMEDEGGLSRLVEEVLSTMKSEGILTTTRLNKAIICAHSGGYRPAAFALERGELGNHVTGVFLFDAFYANQEYFRNWLGRSGGVLRAAYTDHLAEKHTTFAQETSGEARKRLDFTRTSVDHDQVIQSFFGRWLAQLDISWEMAPPQHR